MLLRWHAMRVITSLHNQITNVTQHIEMDQLTLGQKFKIDLLLFPVWLFFDLNVGANFFESRH